MTPRQSQVLAYIKAHIAKHGYPPTHRDIADEFDIHVSSARDALLALERKEYILLTPKVSRGIRVVEPPPMAVERGSSASVAYRGVTTSGEQSTTSVIDRAMGAE